jgi:hypothetical protein
MPAGALYPLDVAGDAVKLRWEAGVDGVFYRALSRRGSDKRRAEQFDWLRFRALFHSEKINAACRADPWLADWEAIALKTAASGFDARRIKPRAYDKAPLVFPLPAAGPWFTVSPFTDPLPWPGAGEIVEIRTSAAVAVYVCPAGVLRCTTGAWTFEPAP